MKNDVHSFRSPTRLIICKHPDYYGEIVDLSELFYGAPAVKEGKSHLWRGAFTGRPSLAAELLPAVRAMYEQRTLYGLSQALHSLRAFFRFLDSYEGHIASESSQIRINHLHQISGALLEAFAQPGPNNKWERASFHYAASVRGIICFAVAEHGLPELFISRMRRPRTPQRDTPSTDEGLRIIRHLRSSVLATFRRWQRADRLATQGRDLLAHYREYGNEGCKAMQPTEADAHATYRAFIRECGHPLPHVYAILAEFKSGDSLPRHWWPRLASGEPVSWSQLVAGMYPTSEDVATFALMCLARSAWNPATLLNLELNNWHSNFDSDNIWIYAAKDRAQGALQYSISARSEQTGMYNVIARLIERASPLRLVLDAAPEDTKRLEIGKRSPWIGASKRPGELVFVADPREIRTLNNWLKRLVVDCNATLGEDEQVSHITTSDFRDIAAAATYQRSNYSMLMVMVLLGHRRISSSAAYGFRKSNRAESHKQILKVVEDVFEQSRATERWDATLTRAAVEGVQFSGEDIGRLSAYRSNRTYSGALCKDPTRPPRDIDPNHPNDGRTLCIQGHLCVARSCTQALVLNDSLDAICRTIAELEWRESNSGITRFQASSAWEDLARLRSTADQWPKDEVDRRIADWARRIDSGSHRPIVMAGQH